MERDAEKETAGNWLRHLKMGITEPEHVMALVGKDTSNQLSIEDLQNIKRNFDVRIPASFLERIKESPALSKQVIPSKDELIFEPEELEDPIGDEPHSPVKGLTHRYANRVLIKLTHHCGVYCRFCFRRYKVSKPGETLSAEELTTLYHYINSNPKIWEVIFSGGDPFILTDRHLERSFAPLREIEHVKVMRFHTRIPSVLPERITPTLIHILKNAGPMPWIVAHINSADELTSETTRALAALIDSGIPVLSQSVLLKGVNDSTRELSLLFQGLVERGVKPYYLHHLDLAKGTNHFRVELPQALELYETLRANLSGTCIPQFILDIPGGHGKISMNPENLRFKGNGVWTAKSPLTGQWHDFSYPGNSISL